MKAKTEMKCAYCNQPMERHKRNSRPIAEILYVCFYCGASTKRLAPHDLSIPESASGFIPPPEPGEWTR